MEGNSIKYWILFKLIIYFMSIGCDNSFPVYKIYERPCALFKNFWQQ